MLAQGGAQRNPGEDRKSDQPQKGRRKPRWIKESARLSVALSRALGSWFSCPPGFRFAPPWAVVSSPFQGRRSYRVSRQKLATAHNGARDKLLHELKSKQESAYRFTFTGQGCPCSCQSRVSPRVQAMTAPVSP